MLNHSLLYYSILFDIILYYTGRGRQPVPHRLPHPPPGGRRAPRLDNDNDDNICHIDNTTNNSSNNNDNDTIKKRLPAPQTPYMLPHVATRLHLGFPPKRFVCICVYICVYIYIYIYV